MRSLWEDGADFNGFDGLDGNLRTDVLIIGGGMAGLLCAYMLDRAGVDYALVEAQTICGGITKNTTAKITSQHGLIYDKLIREFGTEKARLYIEANESALESFRSLCGGMDCDFETKDAYVYSIDDRAKIERELEALGKIGYNAEFAEELPLPFKTAGAVRFSHQAQFDPLKFASAISRDLNIYEHTEVKKLTGTEAVTDRGRICADSIIVTTHFPFLNTHGSYFLKMYQYRSYVIALEDAPDVKGMYVDEAQKGMSFRNHGKLLLIGGGGHRTGKKGGGWRELRDLAKRCYPDAQEKCHWATQDCMTLDGAPYIGEYSANTEGLYVAAGFNKWGMTSSMVAAQILTDMITGKENAYKDVFFPSRSILRPQLAVNAFEAVVNLLTPSSRRCPHLGCALKWNPHEQTWDCPCHGSRFSDAGRLIDNPATGDLKK